MKKHLASIGVVLSGLLLAGCIVRTTEPWLTDASKVTSPALAGAWQDAQQKMTVFFTAKGSNYQVRVIQEGKPTSLFIASLHKIDANLLLVVGPTEPVESLEMLSRLPAYLLFNAVLEGDTLKLLMLDPDVVPGRIRGSELAPALSGSKDKGFLLTAPTAGLDGFVRAQLNSPDFFKREPLYTLRKMTTGAAAPVPAKAP